MDYDYYGEEIPRPLSSEVNFLKTTEQSFKDFMNNSFIKKVESGDLKITDLHSLLHNLFYQVYYSSSSFALAAGKCNWEQKIIRDYLIKHAEEEKTHWCWILNDLKSTGCNLDPRSSFPNYKAVSYFSYAHFLANKNPIFRLAMAYFLEGLSAKFGQSVGAKVCDQLSLTKEQVSFFMLHGGLDQGHSEEVLEVIKTQKIEPETWAEMSNVVICTSKMYSELYNI